MKSGTEKERVFVIDLSPFYSCAVCISVNRQHITGMHWRDSGAGAGVSTWRQCGTRQRQDCRYRPGHGFHAANGDGETPLFSMQPDMPCFSEPFATAYARTRFYGCVLRPAGLRGEAVWSSAVGGC